MTSTPHQPTHCDFQFGWFTKLIVVAAVLISLSSCEDRQPSGYQNLKQKSGSTDEELERAIMTLTHFYSAMGEIEDQPMVVEDFVEFMQSSSEIMADIEDEDQTMVIFTLGYLNILENESPEAARDQMEDELAKYALRDYPKTEHAELLRSKILEYAENSETLSQKMAKAKDQSQSISE